MPTYTIYNSRTGRMTSVKAKNETAARRKGRRLIGTKTGVIRAYRVVRKKRR